jgi:hypothetical protein
MGGHRLTSLVRLVGEGMGLPRACLGLGRCWLGSGKGLVGQLTWLGLFNVGDTELVGVVGKGVYSAALGWPQKGAGGWGCRLSGTFLCGWGGIGYDWFIC